MSRSIHSGDRPCNFWNPFSFKLKFKNIDSQQKLRSFRKYLLQNSKLHVIKFYDGEHRQHFTTSIFPEIENNLFRNATFKYDCWCTLGLNRIYKNSNFNTISQIQYVVFCNGLYVYTHSSLNQLISNLDCNRPIILF